MGLINYVLLILLLFSLDLVRILSVATALDWIPYNGSETVITEVSWENVDRLDASIPYESRTHHILPKWTPFRLKLALIPFKIACDRNLMDRGHEFMKQACHEPDPMPGCHSENTIALYLCYESYFESGTMKNLFSMKNVEESKNNVTKACKRVSSGRKPHHGIGVAICVRRMKGIFEINAQVELSYSEKTYPIAPIELPIANMREHTHVAIIQFGPMDTQLTNASGSVISADERPAPLSAIGFGPKSAVTLGSLVDSFSDMQFVTHGNGSITHRIHFVHTAERHVCVGLKPSELNEKSILLKGCETYQVMPKPPTCIQEYKIEDTCKKMKALKHKICGLMWKCEYSLSEPTIPPELENRTLPSWLRNDAKNKKSEHPEDPWAKFIRKTRCDNDDDFTFGKDIILRGEDDLQNKLNNWEEICAKQSKQSKKHLAKRQVTNRANFKWPSPIKYKIDGSLDEITNIIQEALANIMQHTCIDFREDQDVSEAEDHMYYNFGSCSAPVGRWFGRNNIYLNAKYSGSVVHETGHALGLHHEHERPDRDNYIWTKSHDKDTALESNLQGMPYDYSSIMHYQAGRDGIYYNMISLPRIYQDSVGPTGRAFNDGLSFKDAKILNFNYCGDIDGCKDKLRENMLGCKNGGYPDPKKQCRECRCQDGFDGNKCDQLKKNDPLKCSSSMGLYDIQPEVGEYKLFGKIIGMGSCYWRITKPKDTMNRDFNIHGIVINNITGLKCPHVSTVNDCGIGWILPCANHLRIHYLDEKTESGARVCCQPELPFALQSNSRQSISDTVLLALKVDEPIGEVSFELNFTIGAIQPKLTPSNNCETLGSLWKEERNPDQLAEIICPLQHSSESECLKLPDTRDFAWDSCQCVPNSVLTFNGNFTLPHDHSECPEGGCYRCPFGRCKLCGEKFPIESWQSADEKKPMFYARCYERNGESKWYWKNTTSGELIQLDEFMCVIQPKQQN